MVRSRSIICERARPRVVAVQRVISLIFAVYLIVNACSRVLIAAITSAWRGRKRSKRLSVEVAMMVDGFVPGLLGGMTAQATVG